MAALSPCGGCGELVGNVHVCPVCQISMHTWCGTPEGPEGFGQKIMCPKCLAHERPVSITSASPIIAAFDTMARQTTTSNGDAVKSTVTGNNSRTTNSGEDGATAVIAAGHGRTVVIFDTKRKRQDVSTVSKRRAVVMWMQEQHELGETALAKAAVDHLPEVFKNEKSRDSDRKKASRWWAERETLTDLPRGSRTVSKVTADGRKVLEVKALPGRGRPQSEWVSWLYPELLSEFTRLRKAGFQFDTPLLRQLAIRTVEQATGKFNKKSRDSKGVTIIERLTNSWIQYFMEKHGIVLRSQTGKKQVSEKETKEIRASVARHLGGLQRGFLSGDLDEDTIENIDETHFVIDFDTGKTLGFVGETSIKYAEVVSGGEGMTMVVRLTSGASGRVMPPMMILQNTSSIYPIRGVPDEIQGVCYCTGPKGWMDKRVFRQFLLERRAIRADPHGKKKAIFLDNCGGHMSADECAEELRTFNADLHFLPPNSTDLCQPADSFVIAKLKSIWARKWNAKKLEPIMDGDWQDKVRNDENTKYCPRHYFLIRVIRVCGKLARRTLISIFFDLGPGRKLVSPTLIPMSTVQSRIP